MDEMLVKKAQKGDNDSFTNLVLQLKDQVYRIAYCYLHNEQDSMDAFCNAVEKAFVNIRKLKKTEFFSTWFIRIVINECKQHLRKKEKILEMGDAMYNSPLHLAKTEDILDLKILMACLSPDDRLMIYMKYYMGYSLEEIAETFRMPSGTVKTRIYGNLKFLRARLEIKEA